MKINSPAFDHNTLIPKKYSCEGQNINPPLQIEGVPDQTKSLVLVLSDPDAPKGTFIHWVLYNMPVIKLLPEDAAPGEESENSYGHCQYDGPCPPIGTHRYVFTLVALNQRIPDKEVNVKSILTGQFKPFEIGRASLIGLYQKQTRE